MKTAKKCTAKCPSKPKKMSSLEWKFHTIWSCDYPDLPPVRELKVVEGRRFAFDFAWPELRVALELDGGIWRPGGHTSGVGKTRDCEKDWLATLAGWQVIRWTPNMITTKNIKELHKLLVS